MVETIFIIIIAIVVFDFMFNRLLDILNAGNRSSTIPNELQGIYDEEKYRKQQGSLDISGGFTFLSPYFRNSEKKEFNIIYTSQGCSKSFKFCIKRFS